MEIRLGESDSFLHTDKQARMIIIHVTLNSGKKIQFPYPADKPISAIYDAVSQVSDEHILVPATDIVVPTVSHAVAQGGDTPIVSSPISTDGEIHKECLVKCVKVEPRGDGATIDLEVGKIYRVLTINGPTSPQGKKHAMSYELVDDNAPSPMRIFALPHEVIFYQNRKAPIKKEIGKLGKAGDCPICTSAMVFYKEKDGRFIGECLGCHNILELKDGESQSKESVVATAS